MPYYKDPSNNVIWLDDAAFEYVLPPGSVPITDAEAYALLNPPPTTEQLIAAAVAEKARCTAICNYQISVLTNAVDPDVVDEPDPADAALLILWKKYQQALRKVVTSIVPVTWPVMPALASGTNSHAEPQV